jgi:enoyl-CoA hydratase
MNALSVELRSMFAEALAALDQDESVRVIVLTGAGERAFSAGLDLKELGANQGAVFDAVSANPRFNPIEAMKICRKPIIGAVNGVAVTGGFEMALACDILIASTNARFADTHVRVGVMPGWGLSQRLARLIGPSRAKEMSLTGMFVNAQTALDWGIVNRVVAAGDLQEAAIGIAKDIAASPPSMVARYKSAMDIGGAMTLADALTFETALALDFNGAVESSEIEARREAVQQNNRT